ncbi:polymorphic toxin type 4 domain-containing protein [Georgenia faecalis]|uniref:polymorphic toxin type 4 domain-containing protein n=1 Tax=Georgenia faecalis TaxID=2483799 RepID=UPI000FDB8C8A|nr:polymorphic toxin type 4 domain-containing protein [Georgenia faecalis]
MVVEHIPREAPPAPHHPAPEPVRPATPVTGPGAREQSRQAILAWQQSAGNSAVARALAVAPEAPAPVDGAAIDSGSVDRGVADGGTAGPASGPDRPSSPRLADAGGLAVADTGGRDGAVAEVGRGPATGVGAGPADTAAGADGDGAHLDGTAPLEREAAVPDAAPAVTGTPSPDLAGTSATDATTRTGRPATAGPDVDARAPGEDAPPDGPTTTDGTAPLADRAPGLADGTAPLAPPGERRVRATEPADGAAGGGAVATTRPGAATAAPGAPASAAVPPTDRADLVEPPAELVRPEVERPPAPPAPAATPIGPTGAAAAPVPPGFAEKRPGAPPAPARRAAAPGAGTPPAGGPPARSGAGGPARTRSAPPSLDDPTLDAWKAASGGAVAATTATPVPQAGAAELDAKGEEIDAARAGEKPDYAVDAKAVQPSMPAEPAKEATLDTGPADQALAAVKQAGEQRLTDQTFSPVGTPPPYPTLDPRDFVPVTTLKAVADLEAKLAGKDLSPKERASLTAQLAKAKADVAAIEKAASEGTPAQPPPTVVDQGPASLEPLPPAQADVLGDAVARALGMVGPKATAITAQAVALMKGTGVAPVMTMAQGEEPTVRAELERELEGVAEAAGVTAEQLTAKVAEQKEQVAKETAAGEAQLQVASVGAAAKVEQRAGQEAREIAGAKAAVDAENAAKRSAVEGPPDTEVIEAKREEYLGRTTEVAAMAHAAARAAAQRRTEDLAKAADDQKGVVKQAADAQAAAIRRHWASKAAEPGTAGTPGTAGADQGTVEARPTLAWATTRSAGVDSELTRLQAAATTQTAAIDASIATAADGAKEQIRDWAARQEGRERGWWERLWDSITDWYDQAAADNTAWEKQRNAETRDAMVGDLASLTALKEAQSTGNREAMAAELATLDGEQRALAAAYFRGGMSSIQFVAESTMNRIAGRRAPELAKAMEEQAVATWGWEDLGLLAQKSNPGFSPLVLANKVKGGVEGWGTDEAQVYGGLGGARTTVERAALAACYRATFGVAMEDDVRGDMEDHELERAEALMAGKAAAADAAAIKEAVDGAGTDEDAIKAALRGKTPEEIEAIRAEYRRVYGVELATDLADDLSGPELDTSLALAAGDVDAADASELEEAMDGVGTDEEKLRKVYERIREEEEASAKREGLTAAELQDRIRARNDRVKAKYNARYGDLDTTMTAELADVDEGAVAGLKAQKSDLVDNAEVNLMAAMQSGNRAQIDALRALREHEGVYASDDELEKIARNQHKQADLDVNLDLAAEQARIKAAWEAGDLTPEEFKAAQASWKTRYDARDAAVTAKSQANMGALKDAYATASGGKQTFDQLIAQETSGYSQLEIQDLVAAGGALKPEDEIYYAVAGSGTDEDRLKETLKGKTPEQIAKIRLAYEAKHGKGSFDSDILSDLSGREDLDVGHTLAYGDPETFGKQLAAAKTPEERQKVLDAMRTVLAQRKAFEETGSIGSLWAGTGDPLNSAAQMEQALRRAEEYDAALAKAGPATALSEAELDAARAKFEMNFAGAMEAQEQVRKQIDAYTDVAAQVGAVVVGLAVTVLTAGAAGPAALAAAAAWGAAASAAASMAIKLQLKGAAYSWEEAGVDVAVGVVDAGVSALTAGMGKGVMDALENAIKRQLAIQVAKEGAEELSESAFRALVKEAMAEAIENGVQGMPSAALAAALSDETWKSGDPFGSIVKATGTAGAMGAGMGAGLHVAGEAAGAVVKGLRGADVPAGAVDAPAGAVDVDVPAGGAPDVDVPAGGAPDVDVPAGGGPASTVDGHGGLATAPDPVELDLPPEADPAVVVPKAVDDAMAGPAGRGGPAADGTGPRVPDADAPAPRSPAGPDADAEIDLDDPANAHLVEDIDGVDPRQPHVGDDGVVDLDDPRNRWMLEDKFAGALPEAAAGDAAAARDFFEGFVTSQPGLEAALLRNPVTGEHIVVQGAPASVDTRPGHGVWEGLIPPEKLGTGRWELVAHSHPVDPLTGVTPDWAQVPSGADGDFAVSVHEAQVSGAPVVQEIWITTESGPGVTRYGYDPSTPEPYFIDLPTPEGGREIVQFATMDDYHDWYKARFGGDMGPVPADFPGVKRADAAAGGAAPGGAAPGGATGAPGSATDAAGSTGPAPKTPGTPGTPTTHTPGPTPGPPPTPAPTPTPAPAPGGAPGALSTDLVVGRPGMAALFAAEPDLRARLDAAVAALDTAAGGLSPRDRAALAAMFPATRRNGSIGATNLAGKIADLERLAAQIDVRPDMLDAHSQRRRLQAAMDQARRELDAANAGVTFEEQGRPLLPSAELDADTARLRELLANPPALTGDPIADQLAIERWRTEAVRTGEHIRALGESRFGVVRNEQTAPTDANAATARGRLAAPFDVATAAPADLLGATFHSRVDVETSGWLGDGVMRLGKEDTALSPSQLRDLVTDPPRIGERFAAILGDYHRAHLVGPGFGSELAEGIAHAPSAFNLGAQNKGIERALRAMQATGQDFQVSQRATATRYVIPLAGGGFKHVDVLETVEYTIQRFGSSGERLGQPLRVAFAIAGPPAGTITIVHSDLPGLTVAGF